MATTLQPIVQASFGRHFNEEPYIFNGLRAQYQAIDLVSTTPLASAAFINPRQTSTSSVLSVASAPSQTHNKENRGSCDVLPMQHVKRSASLHVPRFHAPDSPRRIGNVHRPRILSSRHNLGFSATTLPKQKQSKDFGELSVRFSEEAEEITTKCHRSCLDQQLAPLAIDLNNKNGFSMQGKEGLLKDGHEVDNDRGKFSHWANSFRRRKGIKPRPPVRQMQTLKSSGQDLYLDTDTACARQITHRKRLSNSSSGFVETMKTASFSNASISIRQRPHKPAYSIETRGNRSSNVRYSLESDNLTNRPSLDEGALSRALRRRQILSEILMSEESYLVDLRALSNLFSTLLTSVAASSTPRKTSVQRNLLEILHLHTELAKELYRVSTTELAMYRTPDYLLRKPGLSSYVKRRSFEIHPVHRREPQHGVPRHSIGSSDSSTVLCTADPSEAADIARAFRHFMARFLTYEDYCSNYEVMLHEIIASQRSISSWPLYETGVEALTRSIRAIDHQRSGSKRAMTISDLLMSPIQRLTKYPLLFTDLHNNTPVIDCPDSHAEIDLTLQHLRELMRTINNVTDNHIARENIRRRWLLQDLLSFDNRILKANQFRMLGHPMLCGVLHLAYQTKKEIAGAYGLCILFGTHLVMAVPSRHGETFDVIGTIRISDLRIESTSDGKGMQCHTALFSWKIVFESDQQLFEVILSACSAAEEGQWKLHMEMRKDTPDDGDGGVDIASTGPPTSTALDLKPVCVAFGQAGSLAARLSVQRAATVGTRANSYQVIIRNTHKPQDSQHNRDVLAASIHINRSQSLLTTHKIIVLAPKRNERIRLEHALRDVWTRDKLPYPGMTASRSGQIIKASAGSLVRKLSLASMHTPFTRRSASLTIANHKRSTETLSDLKADSEVDHLKHSTVDESKTLDEVLDDPAVIEELVRGHEPETSRQRLPLMSVDRLTRRGATKARNVSKERGHECTGAEEASAQAIVEETLINKKRWSHSWGLLRNFSVEGVRHMLYSSK